MAGADARGFDALADATELELRAQLAMMLVELDDERISGLAGMIADAVLDDFAVTPRRGVAPP